MASPLSYLARRVLFSHAGSSSMLARPFGTTSPVLARRSRLEEDLSVDDFMEYIEEPADVLDSPSAGHLLLQERRMVRDYLRLIENEMPKLVAYRRPFVPPTSAQPLIVRSIEYVGEGHPAQNKKSVVVAVDTLPLQDDMARKRFILLAGSRWTPNPPADAGVNKHAEWAHGFIKISCEDYPEQAMNLKWISDTLDKLVEKANEPDENWEDLPIDLRHVVAKSQKAKKGEHRRGRLLAKPTIRDFPQEWLPKTTAEQLPVSHSS